MMALDTVDIKRQVRVMMIDGGHRVRAHLNTLGIHIGDWLTVVERAPFRGPVLVEINGTRLALGRGVAAKIQVEMDGALQPWVRPQPEAETEQRRGSSSPDSRTPARARSSTRLPATALRPRISRGLRYLSPSAGR